MAWIRTAVQIRADGDDEWWYDLHQFFLCLPKSIVYDEDDKDKDKDEDEDDDENEDDEGDNEDNKMHHYDDFYVVFHSEVKYILRLTKSEPWRLP